jgi:hypothetical protein
VTGDPLIRLNRRLAVDLDGVYRRGEFYMRLLHRLSSIAFGTNWGRLLMLYLVLPFGLAFFTMITPGIAVEEGHKIAGWVRLAEPPSKLKHDETKVLAPGDEYLHVIDPFSKDRKIKITVRAENGAIDAYFYLQKDRDEIFQDDSIVESGLLAHENRTAKFNSLDTVPAGEGSELYVKSSGPTSAKFTVHISEEHAFPMPNLWAMAGLRVFFLLLFHVKPFRRLVFWGLGKVWYGFVSGISWFAHLRILQAILHNRFWTPFRRIVFWPILSAAVCGGVAWRFELDTASNIAIAAGALTFTLVLLNTYLGRNLEEATLDGLLRFWIWLTIDFFPGLLHLIMDLSRACLEAIEQMLYTVNEWLRFQQGENRIIIVFKAILGLCWFTVTYVIRFAVNLLIEPQINPIKHFPVVTVSHKMCLPMIPSLADVLRSYNVSQPGTKAFAIIFGIPGIFGFMVWELKENWKLYGANRWSKLKPVLIGSHGESMVRLLRPGFHSGTIPKLYRRLRRAELRGQMPTVRKILTALHHVAESIEHFVEREMLVILRQSNSWGGLPIELGHIELATNRVLVELRCPGLSEDSTAIAFEVQAGWLLAGVHESGWLPLLTERQQQVFAFALTGLYKMAGVHLVRDQLAENLPNALAYVIGEDGLIVWRGADPAQDIVYPLTSEAYLAPQSLDGEDDVDAPTLEANRVLFSNVPLSWQSWMSAWEADRAGAEAPFGLV